VRQRYKYTKEGIIPGVTNMALQIRRGTDAERQLFIPLQGEIIFTTDTKKLYVGDGTTAGGIAVDTAGDGGEPDGNTTYSISAETVVGGANLRLTGSDASTDNVKLAAGSNVTISRTDADTITIAATGDGGAVQLNELTDVVITGTPTTGQVLKYDGTNWINDTDATGGEGGAATLDELTDVVITGTPSTGQVLKYDGTNWVNGTDNVGGGEGGATVLDELTDVVITGTPSTGQVLKYDGTNWVNDTDSGGATTLDELDDVFIFGTPVIDQVLRYDGINWVNDTVPLTALSVSVEDLTDVTINPGTLTVGQSLVYDGAGWINDIPTLSLDSLSDVIITDLEFTPLEVGMALVYDGNDWVNQYVSLDSLTGIEVDMLTVAPGQTLRYDGINWVNSELTLEDLSDVNYGVLTPNSVLKWDGSEWTAGQVVLEDDLVPTLGGNLDLNQFNITGIGNIQIAGDVQADRIVSNDFLSDAGFTIFAPDVSQALTLEGINRLNEPLELVIRSSRGTLDALDDTLPGDTIGKYSIKGYYDGDYKEGTSIRGRWTLDADLTKVYPKSWLLLFANNNTDVAPAPSVIVRGEGVIVAKVHLATPQTTSDISTNYPTPDVGMIVFDSTLQKFKGYVSDTGLAGGGAPNSTPGWVDLN
jgi:hypothetical protein